MSAFSWIGTKIKILTNLKRLIIARHMLIYFLKSKRQKRIINWSKVAQFADQLNAALKIEKFRSLPEILEISFC